jgi:predicted lipase
MNKLSYEEILINMHLSNLVYLNLNNEIVDEYLHLNFNNNFPNIKLHKFISNSDTDTQVGIFLDVSKDNIYITFRGTSSRYGTTVFIRDVITDINAFKISINNNSEFIHEGFYKALMSIYKDILNEIDEIKNKDIYKYNFYVSGHSLGAGLATLFTYFISDDNSISSIINDKIKLITIGSPKVGNLSFKKSFEKKLNIINNIIVNYNDIITLLLPFFNYYHVGKQYRLLNI